MKFFICVLLISLSAANTYAALFPTARDKNGRILNFDQPKAAAYCEASHLKVPSIRELAEWAILNGATGIRETNFPNIEPNTNKDFDKELEMNQSEGYKAVWKNRDQMGAGGINFYYNKTGFNPIADEGGWFYRSSSSIYLFKAGHYVLDSSTGELNWEDPVLYPKKKLAVKCSDK